MMPRLIIRRMKNYIAKIEHSDREQKKWVCELPPDNSGDSIQVRHHEWDWLPWLQGLVTRGSYHGYKGK